MAEEYRGRIRKGQEGGKRRPGVLAMYDVRYFRQIGKRLDGGRAGRSHLCRHAADVRCEDDNRMSPSPQCQHDVPCQSLCSAATAKDQIREENLEWPDGAPWTCLVQLAPKFLSQYLLEIFESKL